MSPTYCCKNPIDHVLIGEKEEPSITPCPPSPRSIQSPLAPFSPTRRERYTIIEIQMYHGRKNDSSPDGTDSGGYRSIITSHDSISIETSTTSSIATSPVSQVSPILSSDGSNESAQTSNGPSSSSSTSTAMSTLSSHLKQKHVSPSSSLLTFKPPPSIPLLQSLSALGPSSFSSIHSASYYVLSPPRPKPKQHNYHQNKNKQNDNQQDQHKHSANNQSDANGDSYRSIDTFIPQQSKSILKSNKIRLKNKVTKQKGGGDGDIWIERRCVNKKTGIKKMLFVSVKTGDIVREPPSGASRVIYADNLVLRHVGTKQVGHPNHVAHYSHEDACEDDERCDTLHEKDSSNDSGVCVDIGTANTDDFDNNDDSTVRPVGQNDVETIYIIQSDLE